MLTVQDLDAFREVVRQEVEKAAASALLVNAMTKAVASALASRGVSETVGLYDPGLTYADEQGKPMSAERMEKVRDAFAHLDCLSQHERGYVLCWFCKYCHRYLGPGNTCRCTEDD